MKSWKNESSIPITGWIKRNRGFGVSLPLCSINTLSMELQRK